MIVWIQNGKKHQKHNLRVENSHTFNERCDKNASQKYVCNNGLKIITVITFINIFNCSKLRTFYAIVILKEATAQIQIGYQYWISQAVSFIENFIMKA